MYTGLAGQRPAPRNDVPAAVCGRKCQSIAVAPPGQVPTGILGIHPTPLLHAHRATRQHLPMIMIGEKLAATATAN
jgi:hypothetical protein